MPHMFAGLGFDRNISSVVRSPFDQKPFSLCRYDLVIVWSSIWKALLTCKNLEIVRLAIALSSKIEWFDFSFVSLCESIDFSFHLRSHLITFFGLCSGQKTLVEPRFGFSIMESAIMMKWIPLAFCLFCKYVLQFSASCAHDLVYLPTVDPLLALQETFHEHWPPWPKRKSKDFFLELEKNFFVWAAYVQGCSDPSLLYEEILDGLEFAKGALDSAWGSVQVAMGHLEPFLRLGMKTVERRITVISIDGMKRNTFQSLGSTKTVLTSRNMMDENSFKEPNKVSKPANKVAPIKSLLENASVDMEDVLSPHSFTFFNLPIESTKHWIPRNDSNSKSSILESVR
ncbi:hypothetical protein RHMOL_Rhmol06G0133400 [Rhododendron molle]|uniref:Uncharacterized protein n=1 Tax=Rhododendron molle TaxID=49168 RepID=A0ACC0NBW5_RHOML|nr:hypothetical protein RHMOL_Rhmol06G0133400 [Rhododendron molle]